MHHRNMHKRSSKPDFAQNALRVVEISTGETLKPVQKNAAAVALGRLGGLKGGAARASKLSPERRSQIAGRAALTRWNSVRKRKQSDAGS